MIRKITRQEAIKMVQEHGHEVTDLCATDINGKWVSGSSFDEQIGIKESYTLMEVRNWLGY